MSLEKVMKKYRLSEFKYGNIDCCLFLKDCTESAHNITVSFEESEGSSSKYLSKNMNKYKVRTIKDFIEKSILNHGYIEVFEKPRHKDALLLKVDEKYLAGFQIQRFSMSVAHMGLIQVDPSQIVKVFRLKGLDHA